MASNLMREDQAGRNGQPADKFQFSVLGPMKVAVVGAPGSFFRRQRPRARSTTLPPIAASISLYAR